MSARTFESITRAAGDVVCLAHLACDLVAEAESGDTGGIHQLGAVLRAMKAQASAMHSLADGHWIAVHAAEAGASVACAVQAGGAA